MGCSASIPDVKHNEDLPDSSEQSLSRMYDKLLKEYEDLHTLNIRLQEELREANAKEVGHSMKWSNTQIELYQANIRCNELADRIRMAIAESGAVFSKRHNVSA